MKRIAIAIFLLTGLIAGAQHENTWCGHEDVIKELKADPILYQQYLDGIDFRRQLAKETPAKKSSGQIFTIPVVFHVIYWESSDSISADQLQSGLDALNRDFRRQNPDTGNVRSIFKHLGADIGVEFKLATKDPQGNPTTGIRYIKDNITLRASASVRVIDRWPHERYFNIWVVRRIDDSGKEPGVTTLGYSFIPFPGQTGDYDGMVIRHDQVGTIGTAAGSGQNGRTMVHEAGHYLGLAHTFEGGCDSIYWNDGDGIDDTPPVAAPNYSCNKNINSCHTDTLNDLPDMVENYMDYAPGTCMNLFTIGQKELMMATFANPNLRSLLVSEENMERTGVLGVKELTASTFGLYPNPNNGKFTISANQSLEGAMVSITDLSGKMVESKVVLDNVQQIDLDFEGSKLLKGIYLVRISGEGFENTKAQKLIIQ